MSTTRTIRPARREDLDQLIELSRRSWLSAFAQTAPFPLIVWWITTDRARSLCEEHWREMLVCEEGAAVSGLVQSTDNEINGLWVRPDRQRTGVGTALLRAAEQVIRRAGHGSAWLTCSAWNAGALRYYMARGYVRSGRRLYVNAAGIEVEDIRLDRQLPMTSG